MNKVSILRGISGTGKSTFIAREFPTAIVVSADHYFIKDGVYTFNKEKLGAAHATCFRKFTEALNMNKPLVVVDNTNLSTGEMRKYVETAQSRGYEVEILTIKCDPEVAAARNAHSVPRENILKMHEKLQRAQLPAEWPHFILESSATLYQDKKNFNNTTA
jgi:predicted kinase